MRSLKNQRIKSYLWLSYDMIVKFYLNLFLIVFHKSQVKCVYIVAYMKPTNMCFRKFRVNVDYVSFDKNAEHFFPPLNNAVVAYFSFQSSSC